MTTLHTATSALVNTIKQLSAYSPELRCINLDEIEAALASDQSSAVVSTLADTTGKLLFIEDTGVENLSPRDLHEIKQTTRSAQRLLKTLVP